MHVTLLYFASMFVLLVPNKIVVPLEEVYNVIHALLLNSPPPLTLHPLIIDFFEGWIGVAVVKT